MATSTSKSDAPFAALKAATTVEEDAEFDDDEEDDDLPDPVELPQGMEDAFSRDELQELTVQQLKQQLRLRGFKVSGRKQDLIDRLLPTTTSSFTKQHQRPKEVVNDKNDDDYPNETDEAEGAISKARQFADDKGKELVDVTEYLEGDDVGKNTRTFKDKNDVLDAEFEKEDNNDDEESDTADKDNKAEVWGSEARIVDDYEGRNVVVDCLSKTVVEFKGSNQSYVSASVVASRDALKPFLAGGGGKNQTTVEAQLREIQTKREKASKLPIRFEDDIGVDEGDETGLYANVVERDYTDWGKYTVTGAQLSASEVQGVLLLSDVYGAFTPDIQTLAEKIAFECQPVVVMVPDLFRGNPWKEDPASPGHNEKGLTYEAWRSTHSDLRVSIDIRAAAACLRETYGVSSVVVWGACYGGGRALEAAAGYLPNDGSVHDIDGSVGPPLVNPLAAVVWYPARYNATALFGKDRIVGNSQTETSEKQQQFAVMGVFAGNDEIPGATPEDAANLKTVLAEDDRVKDLLVKVFQDQDHGFAHIGLAARSNMDSDTAFERFVDDEFGGAGQVNIDDGDADVACLLSTAFMETYSRVFLPTTGAPIHEDNEEWSTDLEMKGLSESNTRDIRQEIVDSLENYEEPELGGLRIDPNDKEQQEELVNMLRNAQSDEQKRGPYKIQDGDDLTLIYAKLKAADESFEIF